MDDTPLNQSAISLHEWYMSMIGAGFTKDEALTILAKVLIGNIED